MDIIVNVCNIYRWYEERGRGARASAQGLTRLSDAPGPVVFHASDDSQRLFDPVEIFSRDQAHRRACSRRAIAEQLAHVNLELSRNRREDVDADIHLAA